MRVPVHVVLVLVVSWCALAPDASSQEPVRVTLESTALDNPAVVLSASDFNRDNPARPVVCYRAFDCDVILPGRRKVFVDAGDRQTFNIAGVACTLTCPGGTPTLTLPAGAVALKPAALGFDTVPLPGKDAYRLAFPRAFTFKERTSVFYRSGVVRAGKIGDQTVRLYDDDLDGVYRAGTDGICIGDDGKVGIFAPVGELLPTSSAVWRITALAPDGTSMTLAPFAGPTGRLNVKTEADVECRLALASDDAKCSFATLTGEASLTLPAGTYKLLYGYLYRAARDRTVMVIVPGKGLPVTVKPGGEVTLTLADAVIERSLDADAAVTTQFEALLELDLDPVEAACDAGDFAKARALLKEITDRAGDGPNFQATRAWIERLGQRLALETSPEGTAFREAETKVLDAVKRGDLAAAKTLAAGARKAFDAVPAKHAGNFFYLARKARADALARYAQGAVPGLRVTYYDHRFSKKTGEEVVAQVSWDDSPGGGRKQFFCCRYVGSLVVPEDGEYELSLVSDEGARMYLDDALVIDHWGTHVLAERSTTLKLTAGLHPIKIEMFQHLGGAALHFRWTPPGGRKVLVPAWALEYE
ncbi:MAG TPA: PA14 domain-containing protein, partial [Planctomycetota bacterium]|nr:PA14 domain-containing protein [Planctomycetota bacterium]